jgi:hypothetical protein
MKEWVSGQISQYWGLDPDRDETMKPNMGLFLDDGYLANFSDGSVSAINEVMCSSGNFENATVNQSSLPTPKAVADYVTGKIAAIPLADYATQTELNTKSDIHYPTATELTKPLSLLTTDDDLRGATITSNGADWVYHGGAKLTQNANAAVQLGDGNYILLTYSIKGDGDTFLYSVDGDGADWYVRLMAATHGAIVH